MLSAGSLAPGAAPSSPAAAAAPTVAWGSGRSDRAESQCRQCAVSGQGPAGTVLARADLLSLVCPEGAVLPGGLLPVLRRPLQAVQRLLRQPHGGPQGPGERYGLRGGGAASLPTRGSGAAAVGASGPAPRRRRCAGARSAGHRRGPRDGAFSEREPCARCVGPESGVGVGGRCRRADVPGSRSRSLSPLCTGRPASRPPPCVGPTLPAPGRVVPAPRPPVQVAQPAHEQHRLSRLAAPLPECSGRSRVSSECPEGAFASTGQLVVA